MIGNRHSQTAHSGRRSLVLVSLLALLSLMCFPMLAQAEDSSEIVYETGPPSAEGHHHSEHEPVAKSSNHTPKSGGTSPTPAESGSRLRVKSIRVGFHRKKAEPGRPVSPEGHQGSPGKGKNNAQKKDAPSPAASSPKVSSDGGGSSPLVPILIALAALAAISIGVLVVRQRKGGRPDSGLPTRAG